MRTERARFLSIGEESEVRMGANLTDLGIFTNQWGIQGGMAPWSQGVSPRREAGSLSDRRKGESGAFPQSSRWVKLAC
ncbi:hypothetical protein KGY73_01390 [bacterium]|nr:hypothetical protein [bacterium]